MCCHPPSQSYCSGQQQIPHYCLALNHAHHHHHSSPSNQGSVCVCVCVCVWPSASPPGSALGGPVCTAIASGSWAAHTRTQETTATYIRAALTVDTPRMRSFHCRAAPIAVHNAVLKHFSAGMGGICHLWAPAYNPCLLACVPQTAAHEHARR